MRIIKILSAAALVASSSTAMAEVSFLLNVDNVNDRSGTDVATGTGSWLLVADTNQDGFANITSGGVSVSDFASGDDLVIARGDFSLFGTPGVATAAPAGLSFGNGWGEGDPLAFVWFPDGGTDRATTANGDHYGLYTSALGEDSSDPWITPADNTVDHNLTLVTSDSNFFFGAGSVDPGSVNANMTVPEPSVSLLGALSVLLLMRRRR